MLNLQQIQEITKSQNVIFGKDNCRFCQASLALCNKLVELKIIDDFVYLNQDQDFDNLTLKQLLLEYNWQPQEFQNTPTKPQVFVQGRYVGDNFEFYKSKWNLGPDMPGLVNPMRFWVILLIAKFNLKI